MIKEEALKKVHEDIFDRSIKNSLGLLPSSGNYYHEFDHKYCISTIPELENFIIVVAKRLSYHNLSLDDFKRVYYVYDKDGNYIEADIVSDYIGFYNTLTEI